MPDKPFFSIIIPVFNSAATLSAALDSILNQTFGSYEVIIIDGLSTDDTSSIISDYAKRLPIQYLSGPDNGIYDAMNKGIRLAEGNWLYFMGGDDMLFDKGVLQIIHQQLNNEFCDLIYGNVIGQLSNTKYAYNTVEKVLTEGLHHQSGFYKRSLFNELGIYDNSFKIAADYHFTLKVFTGKLYQTRYIDINICNYGESGFSSRNYDYKFYSYHYKFLSKSNAVKQTPAYQKCLDDSVYCCLYLAMNKTDILFAWQNLLFYLFQKNALTFNYKVKKVFQMLRWSLLSSK
ncbi:glycosyltransferase family 2 protein [Mucilaginibacter sp. SG564]|uniref:glycosyltransferase family 2 protein n=1 Tax=Mucilaginibacter sp. SG564 TaxID=2587022 RepID=UPI00155412CF|nr:glycosyltransferase family 2 protein [Mucilaginibacter sp. SG564]NOW98521.1 glycosyltransferase involved in cell wall biosynthesis [Mucilaginibacter sp. SG564]